MPMELNHLLEIFVRLAAALLVGGIIGLERTYHGRPAGFRTHVLVAVASTILMLVTVYESLWFMPRDIQRVVIDPTRMAQGIMTGIGFLGAGVIMKDGLSVRGLTTAASIWITSAIGILVGIGFYYPAALATAATLGTLSFFRWIERKLPTELYAHFRVTFRKQCAMAEEDLKTLVTGHGYSIANLTYRQREESGDFEYEMTLRTTGRDSARALSETLCRLERVRGFEITPAGT
jgi:putative Mg2+ transporter-C (MgtC) family protein